MIGLLLYFFLIAIGLLLYAKWREKGLSLATALGWSIGIETSLLLLLALLGAFSSDLVLITNSSIIVGLFLWVRPWSFRLRMPRVTVWLFILLCLIGLSFYSAYLPRKAYDAHKYHYYNAKIIAMDGDLPTWGEVYDHHWYFPQMAELLLAATWSLDPDSYRPAYLLNAFIGVVCCLGVYELTRNLHGSRRTATLAAGLFYLTPIIFIHTTNGYNDLFLGTFTLLGISNMVSGRYQTSGVMFGIGAWSKVFGLLNIAFLLLYLGFKRKRVIMGTLCIAILVGSLFFMRNTITFGDPFSIYKEENAAISISSLAASLSGDRIHDTLGWWFFDYAGGENFVSLTHRGIGVLLPVFLFYTLIRLKGRFRTLLLLAVIWASASLIFCNLGGEGNPKQITRYALPGLIPLCSVSAFGLSAFLSDASCSTNVRRVRSCLVAAAILYPSVAYATIPMADSIVTTGSLLPTEDMYFEKEYPEVVELRGALPVEPYSVKVAWTGMEIWPYMEVTPYVLRQKRAEWPHMWLHKLKGLRPEHDYDYVLVPTSVEPPAHLALRLVYVSEDFKLYEVD